MLITMINVKGLGGPSSAPAQIKKKETISEMC